ncbi:hypothetical protein [Mesorhizobium australicum]|uniref:hypothetical protein n=1 Tax=Mesorhizobium australicum TaxID=536018 RepID=UPI003339780F
MHHPSSPVTELLERNSLLEVRAFVAGDWIGPGQTIGVIGREGSRHGLTEFMERKYVCFGNLAA